MITKKEEYVLGVALANERIASEVVARVISVTPADAAAAQKVLEVISPSKKESKEIEEYLTVALTNRSVAKEISEKLELIVECIKYQAADNISNNAALSEAQSKLKPLSKKSEEYLVVALANRSVAKSIKKKIDDAQTFASLIPAAV